MYLEGEIVRDTKRPAWGFGYILKDSTETKVCTFFEWGGRQELDANRLSLEPVEIVRGRHPILDCLIQDLNWKRTRHSIYVIELDSSVLHHRRFIKANPQYRGDRPCIYVGMTGLTPEKRFQNHKQGRRANSYVKRYGLRLLRPIYRAFNPMPYGLAQVVETEYAGHLRDLRYAVWQH